MRAMQNTVQPYNVIINRDVLAVAKTSIFSTAETTTPGRNLRVIIHRSSRAGVIFFFTRDRPRVRERRRTHETLL